MNKEMLKEKLKAKEIAESEEKYRVAFKTSPDAISITDLNGVYIDINDGFSKILEYSEDEVIGKSSIDINIWYNIKDRNKFIIPIKQFGFVKDLEARFKTKTGKILYGLMSAHIIIIKGLPYVLTITRDITNRKQIANLLKEALVKEQELANILRLAPVALAIREMDGHLSNFNQAAIDLFGYTEEELKKKTFKELMPLKWAKVEKEKLKELIATKSSVNYEAEYIKKDGTIIPVELVVSGIFNDNNQLIKFIGFASDISKRKEMEHIIARNQLLKTVGEMASSVAHDFNNSLQTILGNVELLMDLDSITPEIKEHIDIIKSTVNDASERVKSLQRFGDKKQIKNESQFMDLENLINEVLTQTRPLWKGKMEKGGLQIDINKNFQKNIKILGNEGELRSVFYNIIKNAIEAMPKGGLIKINTKKIDNDIIIDIIDTGIGMPEEVQANIFKPFYSTKGFGMGRGLGLSGVFTIIQEHLGKIEINSELNRGTTFKIILPYSQFEEKENNNNFIEEYLKKLSILWVDDEESLLKLAKKILTKLGHKASIAISGYEALELLKNKKYDIIITDIGMPKMNGWQLIKEIKKQIDYSPKIIVLTGWGGEINKKEINNYNIDGLLEKPVTIKQIQDIISKIMNENN